MILVTILVMDVPVQVLLNAVVVLDIQITEKDHLFIKSLTVVNLVEVVGVIVVERLLNGDVKIVAHHILLEILQY